MGMKPRKTPTSNYKFASASLQESINAHAGGLRELLKDYYKVPEERWQEALSVSGIEDDYAEFTNDRDTLWILGWFRGAADALGCDAVDLVVL